MLGYVSSFGCGGPLCQDPKEGSTVRNTESLDLEYGHGELLEFRCLQQFCENAHAKMRMYYLGAIWWCLAWTVTPSITGVRGGGQGQRTDYRLLRAWVPAVATAAATAMQTVGPRALCEVVLFQSDEGEDVQARPLG